MFFHIHILSLQGGPWSDPLEVVSGAGVPDPPKSPMVTCRSPHSAIVSWEAPVNNGATITDYRLEWQHKSDITDFSQVNWKIIYIVKTVICDPSRDLNEKVTYDRGLLIQSPYNDQEEKGVGLLNIFKIE